MVRKHYKRGVRNSERVIEDGGYQKGKTKQNKTKQNKTKQQKQVCLNQNKQSLYEHLYETEAEFTKPS